MPSVVRGRYFLRRRVFTGNLLMAGALSVELGGHCYRELFRGTNRRPTIIAHPHLRAAIKFAVRSTSQRDGRLAEAAGRDAVVLAFPASTCSECARLLRRPARGSLDFRSPLITSNADIRTLQTGSPKPVSTLAEYASASRCFFDITAFFV